MTKSNKPVLLPVLLVVTVILVAFDQWIKHLCVTHLKGHEPIILIRGVLEFTYLENHGAAFSMLQGQQWFFWILTVVFIGVAVWFYIRVPKNSYYMPIIFTVAVLVAGAIGNFIDRITYKYVVDFIYFRLINFPVFNIADIYVTLSMVALIALVMFKYKDDDFAFLTKKEA